MNIHPSRHLDFARERRLESMAEAERLRVTREASRSSSQAVEPARDSQGTFRELAHRVDGGIDVALLWSARENRLAVTVFDRRVGQLLVLDAERDQALEVFYHPYAHARSHVAA
jgi:hypothetical protein